MPMRRATLVGFFSLAVCHSILGGDGQDRPAKMLDYYAMSPFPHLISPDFSYIQRFYACFEVDGHVNIATKLWPIGKHDYFTSSRQGGTLSKGGDGPILSVHYDRRHIWVTFARSEMAEMTINHSRKNFFHDDRCKIANQNSN